MSYGEVRGGEVRGGEGRRRIKAVRSRVRLYRDQLPTIKQKVFGVESEILIKYKIIKWPPSRKAPLLLPGGKFTSSRAIL